MGFRLSARSRDRLKGVHPRLVSIVAAAITTTMVDFGVNCGLRTPAKQAQFVQEGRSRTMNSKHLTGHAVDLIAYVGGQVSWEGEVYDEIADAMRTAAMEQGTPLRWGGAWQFTDEADTDRWKTEDICHWGGTCDAARLAYIDLRRSQDRRPFIDCPHFELFPELTAWT